MGIVSVEERHDRSGNWQRNYKRSYKRTFLVNTDSPDEDAVNVMYAIDPNTGVQIPSLGVLYRGKNGNFDGGAFCEDVSAECDDEDGKGWKVTCSYGPYDPSQFDSQNPLDAPAKVHFGLSRQSIACDQDNAGNPIVNSAGQSFDPPIEKDESRLVLSVDVNVASFDPILISQYKDSVNNGEFWGCPPKTVKFMNASAELDFSGDCPVNNGFFWAVTWEFEVKEDTWAKKILDQGLMCLDTSTGNLQHCADEEGQPSSEPLLLDGAGHQAAVGASPIYLTFDVYNEMDFSIFGLNLRGP